MFIHHHCFPMFFLLQHALTVVKSTRISWISQPILLNALQLRRPKQSGITEWFGYSSGSTFGNRPVPFVSDVVIAALLGLKTAGGAIAGNPAQFFLNEIKEAERRGAPHHQGSAGAAAVIMAINPIEFWASLYNCPRNDLLIWNSSSM